MAEIIIKKELIDKEIILCGIYIAELLTSIINIKNLTKSWFAVDYIVDSLSEKNPPKIKQEADVYLLIYTVFQVRAEINEHEIL